MFENPSHDYTRRLLSAVPVADPTASRNTALIEGEIPNPVRRVGDEPAILSHEEINPGHFIAKSA
ncbi:Glutathione import ATP-binding protein GsiA [compost metagenome]